MPDTRSQLLDDLAQVNEQIKHALADITASVEVRTKARLMDRLKELKKKRAKIEKGLESAK